MCRRKLFCQSFYTQRNLFFGFVVSLLAASALPARSATTRSVIRQTLLYILQIDDGEIAIPRSKFERSLSNVDDSAFTDRYDRDFEISQQVNHSTFIQRIESEPVSL